MRKHNNTHPFAIRDCALVTLATGIRAQSLRELRLGLRRIPVDSVYHHFWGRLLQPRFDDPEYNNDFAAWAFRALNEKELAERLAVLDPTKFPNAEALCDEIADIIDERLDEAEYFPWAKADQQFYFLKSQIIVFDTGNKVQNPDELGQAVISMTPSSIYYHFIDARRRNDNWQDDFSLWVSQFGDAYKSIRKMLLKVDPFFSSLKGIQMKLIDLFGCIEEAKHE